MNFLEILFISSNFALLYADEIPRHKESFLKVCRPDIWHHKLLWEAYFGNFNKGIQIKAAEIEIDIKTEIEIEIDCASARTNYLATEKSLSKKWSWLIQFLCSLFYKIHMHTQVHLCLYLCWILPDVHTGF